MSTDPGSFAVHFPCRCVDCALRHGDQAEDSESAELHTLRREVASLKIQRDHLNACVVTQLDHAAKLESEVKTLTEQRDAAKEACARLVVDELERFKSAGRRTEFDAADIRAAIRGTK